MPITIWQYLQIRIRLSSLFPSEGQGVAAKAIVKKPVAVYIEQVYEYGDFSLLRIGT